MDGDERREEIIKMLSSASKPLSGGSLGKTLNVSRQVIVQDVALLRAQGFDIIATARGYVLYKKTDNIKQRVILVKHNFGQISDELNTIVDFGGLIRNVLIDHSVYGEMAGNMMLQTRHDVEHFVDDISKVDIQPLMNLTHGIHMHTIEASSEEILDEIEKSLDEKGYLYKEG